jgi:hypothetical protein
MKGGQWLPQSQLAPLGEKQHGMTEFLQILQD